MSTEEFNLQVNIEAQFKEFHKQINNVIKSLDKVDNTVKSIDFEKSFAAKSLDNVTKSIAKLNKELKKVSTKPIEIKTQSSGGSGGGGAGSFLAGGLAGGLIASTITKGIDKGVKKSKINMPGSEFYATLKKELNNSVSTSLQKSFKGTKVLKASISGATKNGMLEGLKAAQGKVQQVFKPNVAKGIQANSSVVKISSKTRDEFMRQKAEMERKTSRPQTFDEDKAGVVDFSKPTNVNHFGDFGGKGLRTAKNAIGSAVKGIRGHLGKLGGVFESAKTKAAGFAAGIPIVGKTLSAFIGKIHPVTIAIAALVASMISVTKAALAQIPVVNDLINQSNKLGASANKIQQFQNALSLIGIDADVANESIKNISESISDAAKESKGTKFEALEQLGLDAKSLQQLSPDQQLLKVVNALDKVENSSDRTRLALELGSEDLSRVTSASGDYGDSLTKLLAISKEVTTQFSTKDLKAIRELNMEQARTALIAKKNGQMYLKELAPSIKFVMKAFNDLKETWGESSFIKLTIKLTSKLADVFGYLIKIVTWLGDKVDTIFEGWVLIFEEIGYWVELIGEKLGLIEEPTNKISDATDGVAEGFNKMSNGAVSALSEIDKKTKETVKTLLDEFGKGNIKVKKEFETNILGQEIGKGKLVADVPENIKEEQKERQKAIAKGTDAISNLKKRRQVAIDNVKLGMSKIGQGDAAGQDIIDINSKSIKEINSEIARVQKGVDKAKQKFADVNDVQAITVENGKKVLDNTEGFNNKLKLIASSASEVNLESPLKFAAAALKKAQKDFDKGLISKDAVENAQEVYDKIVEGAINANEKITSEVEKNENKIQSLRDKLAESSKRREEIRISVIKKAQKDRLSLLKEIAKKQEEIANKGLQSINKGSFQDMALKLRGNEALQAKANAFNTEKKLEQDETRKQLGELDKQDKETIKEGKELVKETKSLKKAIIDNNKILTQQNKGDKKFITVSF